MQLLRPLLAAVLFASPAAATTLTTLVVDSGQSFLIADSGPIEALAGTLRIEIGTLPFGPGNTSFDLVDLDLATTFGGTIVLDPAQPAPGLGVLSPSGAFLIPTLFLRLSRGGDTLDLALPDVTGSVELGPGGALSVVTTAFAIATPEALVNVTLRAEVPEPASALLGAFGLAALATAARRRAQEGVR